MLRVIDNVIIYVLNTSYGKHRENFGVNMLWFSLGSIRHVCISLEISFLKSAILLIYEVGQLFIMDKSEKLMGF